MSASHIARSHIEGETHPYIPPFTQINVGIWVLWTSATLFLGARLWCKISRRHGSGVWYDDYILIASWLVLLMNNILISVEYATGYVQDDWTDRIRIMVNISSCGTLLNQVMSKTAFAVTLLRISKRPLHMVLWFCIISMHFFMFFKVILQWGKVCGSKGYDVYYRIDFCVSDDTRDNVKNAGNYYNMLMDFVFAVFPWLITWKLDIDRKEKISLCVTLSLGMIIAISTMIRTIWKDDDVPHDEWYFLNNAHSQVWFSSEICGTIIVQCVPILRPFLKETASNFQSSRLTRRSRALSSSFIKTSKNTQSRRQSLPLRDTCEEDEPNSARYTDPFDLDMELAPRRPSIVPSEDIIRHRPGEDQQQNRFSTGSARSSLLDSRGIPTSQISPLRLNGIGLQAQQQQQQQNPSDWSAWPLGGGAAAGVSGAPSGLERRPSGPLSGGERRPSGPLSGGGRASRALAPSAEPDSPASWLDSSPEDHHDETGLYPSPPRSSGQSGARR